MSWIDQIQEVTAWRGEPWPCDWSQTEAGLEAALPAEYKELCERFGPGYFSDRIRIFHDRGDEGILGGWESELALCNHGGPNLWEPYSIYGYSGPRGLINWSYTDWGKHYWLADADVDPGEWPILVTGDLMPVGSWTRYDMSVPELIYRAMTDPEFELFNTVGAEMRPSFFRFDPDAEEEE